MKMSKMLNLTMREVPAEAEISSHQLMLRAGLMRKMASGVYNFMPLGLKALKNVENIVRDEMNNTGAQEFLASAVIPSELWQDSGRWDAYGAELFRFKDRNDREFCLGPTHEEVFTDLARQEIKSYKQLPLNLYQIQTKYRDERRPRFGVMRSREFIMKDAYSFDKDEKGLDESYLKMQAAYIKIFNRCGLDVKCVEADSGAIGGSNSAEFMVKSSVGEDDVVFCSSCDYAANMEKAAATAEMAEKEEHLDYKEVETPEVKTIEELVAFFNTDSKKFAKTLIYNADGKIIAVMVRGDRAANETKISNALGGVTELSMASPEEVYAATGAKVGFAGPIGIKVEKLFVDNEVANMYNFIVGANKADYHLMNVNYGRDFQGVVGDFRNIEEGEKCPKCGEAITISRGTEVGHIFKLGTKYSKPMGATFIDEKGEAQPLEMGCYGIGINRTLASVIEQHHDENGIIWPLSIAPFQVSIIIAVTKNEDQVIAGEQIYRRLREMKVEAILDDREERAGVKFKDADLMGAPIRITVGKKISEGMVEFKLRDSQEVEVISLDEIYNKVMEEFKKNNIEL